MWNALAQRVSVSTAPFNLDHWNALVGSSFQRAHHTTSLMLRLIACDCCLYCILRLICRANAQRQQNNTGERPGYYQVKLTDAVVRILASTPPLLVTYWQFAMAPLVLCKHSTYTGIRQRLRRFYEFTMSTVRKLSSQVQKREKKICVRVFWLLENSEIYLKVCCFFKYGTMFIKFWIWNEHLKKKSTICLTTN